MRNCRSAITGQMRNTNGAGVTGVRKSIEKALLVVGPTARVITARSVAAMSGIRIVCIVMEIKPKYVRLAKAGT